MSGKCSCDVQRKAEAQSKVVPSDHDHVLMPDFFFTADKDTDQGPVIIDRTFSKDTLTVQCKLAEVVHGTMMPQGPHATLMVFQFGFLPLGHRRFKTAKITIDFSAGSVQTITPSGKFEMMKSTTKQEVTYGLSPSVELDSGILKDTTGFTWKVDNTGTKVSYANIVGYAHSEGDGNRETSRMNVVIWELSENKETKMGIPSSLQTAILLQRDTDYDHFSAKITISGKADSSELVSDIWGKLYRSSHNRDHTVTFCPRTSTGTVEDATNLKKINIDTYRRLVSIQNWTDGDKMSDDKSTDKTPKTGDKPQSPTTTTRALSESTTLETSTVGSP